MTERPGLRLIRGDEREPLLRARVVPLGPAFDLLAAYPGHAGFLFDRDGVGVAADLAGSVDPMTVGGDGIAGLARDVLAGLRAIVGANESGPVAVGGIAFDQASGAMWIPSVSVRRGERGGTWLTTVSATGEEPPPFEPARPTHSFPHEAFTSVQTREVPSGTRYAEAVTAAVQRIRASELMKVVLARSVEVEAGRPLDPCALAHRLRAVDPRAYTFATPAGVDASAAPVSLVGASPEQLVRRHGRELWSTPLAGSAPRSGDPDEDRANAETLLASAKNREEHAIVVDAIRDVLDPLCERLHWDPDPVLMETANVWHLATRFEGMLHEPAPTALELVAALHPTPAVGGAPTDVALDLIHELEPFERDGYAGPVGWMDAAGDGEWAIALRCARLTGEHATLYAGAGIVADSQPIAELDETERKFRAFLDSLRWG